MKSDRRSAERELRELGKEGRKHGILCILTISFVCQRSIVFTIDRYERITEKLFAIYLTFLL